MSGPDLFSTVRRARVCVCVACVAMTFAKVMHGIRLGLVKPITGGRTEINVGTSAAST